MTSQQLLCHRRSWKQNCRMAFWAAVQAADCSFLYFSPEMLDAALAEACVHPEEARRLPCLLAAFSDAHSLLSTYPGSPGSSHEVLAVFTELAGSCIHIA